VVAGCVASMEGTLDRSYLDNNNLLINEVEN